MKSLLVGDVHGRVEDLDDCEVLLKLVESTANEHQVDRVVFLGDQYHQFALVNVEPQRFWLRWFERLRKERDVIALVGNHDRPGDKSAVAHAMQVHRDAVMVVESPFVLGEDLFLPYYHDPVEFLAETKRHPGTTRVFCHQTFQGARYENGFYAKGAVDPEQVPQQRIISGHIHSPSSFSKVWYPGSPRYLTISDANIGRHIYVQNDDPKGQSHGIATTGVVRAIWQLTDVEGGEGPTVAELLKERAKQGDRVVVNLQGTQAWCEERRRALHDVWPSIRFRTFFTDGRSAKVRESDGVQVAFRKHLDTYQPKHGTSREALRRMVEERIRVA